MESNDKTIASLQGKFQACYADGLKKDPKMAGSTTVTAVLKGDGSVESANANNTQGLSPAVTKCLTDTMKSARFPPPKAAQLTTIDVPLSFAARY